MEAYRVDWRSPAPGGLAERVHAVFRECPFLGVDVIRDIATESLYVLEINPGGDVWHLSSRHARRTYPPEYRKSLYTQFDALPVAADALIEKTRAEAE